VSDSKPTSAFASCGREAPAAEPAGALTRLIGEELGRPAPAGLAPLVAEIRRRHGAAVAAILFYGSCLRKARYEDGVLDFYVLVDAYREAYRSRSLAWANAILPPNVFYCEVAGGSGMLRSKYAVISTDDFRRAATLAWLQSIVWARFCQPAVCAYARDAAARAAAVAAGVEAALTVVAVGVSGMPAGPFRAETLWQRVFQETYGAELRVESPETIREIYDAAAERFDRVAVEALRELDRRGVLTAVATGPLLQVDISDRQRRRLRRSWGIRRALGKPIAAVRLVKSMATFGDWLPYALWKLERHSGVRIALTPWQRRHPWIACWPVFVRLLSRRVLR